MALAARERPDWPLLMGPVHLLVESMTLGAAGGVAGGANLAPGLFVAPFDAFLAPERERVAAWLDSFGGKGFLV